MAFEPKNNQEIFNKVVTHLITQGKPAEDSVGQCSYRTPDPEDRSKTLMCAVGCLLSDDEYSEDIEGWPVEDLIEEGFLGGYDPTLLSRLQVAHDNYFQSIQTLKNKLIEIAEEFSLKFPKGFLTHGRLD